VVPLAEVKRDAILNALRLTNGNCEEAAGLLGISEQTMHRKMRAYRKEAETSGAMADI
jgi:transcriptional regulator of acetoin/glycerol metabolism